MADSKPKKVPYEKRQTEEPPPSFIAGMVATLQKAYPQAEIDEAKVRELHPFFRAAWRRGYRADQTAAATCSCDGKSLFPSPAALVGPLPKYLAPKGAERGQVFGAGALRLPAAADKKLRALRYQEQAVARQVERARELAARGNETSSKAAHKKAQELRDVSVRLYEELLDEAHKLGVIAPAERPAEAVPPAPQAAPKPQKPAKPAKAAKPPRAEKPVKVKAEKPVKVKAEKPAAPKPRRTKAAKPQGVQVTAKGWLTLDGQSMNRGPGGNYLQERFPDRQVLPEVEHALWWRKAIERYWPAPKEPKPAKVKASKPAAKASESIPGCPSEHRWRLADHMLCWVGQEHRYADLNYEFMAVLLHNGAGGAGVPISAWQQTHATVEYFEADLGQAEHLAKELAKEYPGVQVALVSRPRAKSGKPGERARQVLQPGLVVATPRGDLRIDRIHWTTQTQGRVFANGTTTEYDALDMMASIDRGESQILPLAPEIPRPAPPAKKAKKTPAPKPAPAAAPAAPAEKGKKMPTKREPVPAAPAAPAPAESADDAEIGAMVNQGFDQLLSRLQGQARAPLPEAPSGT